jgi:hypothetical protein
VNDFVLYAVSGQPIIYITKKGQYILHRVYFDFLIYSKVTV